MSKEEMIEQIGALKAVASLMLEKCSEIEAGLGRSATGSTSRKGQNEIVAKVLAKRHARIDKKIKAAAVTAAH